MKINKGELCFIKNDFFEKVNDPFLKCNYETTMRPHYYTFQDKKTNLFWMVPCSSKVEKFEKIIREKIARGKKVDGIAIVKIQSKKSVLLFQDMFPITEQYIDKVYIRQGKRVGITDPALIKTLDAQANKVVALLRHGVKFTQTQPDINRIERLMVDEMRMERESAIIRDIKAAGFQPTLSLLKNMGKLQELTGKNCTLKDVSVLKKFEDITKGSIKDIVNDIVKECKVQEQSKLYVREL